MFTITKEEAFNFPQWKYQEKTKQKKTPKTLSRHFLIWGELQETVKQGKYDPKTYFL